MPRERYGPRETPGGYQAPAVDSVQIRRGDPIRQHKWMIQGVHVDLQIIPLLGGRPNLFEVALVATDPTIRHTDYIPCMLRGRQLAEEAFQMTAAELDAGYLPDRIILPADAPVGW